MIVVNLDVMMAKRKIGLGELAEKIGLTQANLSILKNNKARAVRFSTLDAICKALDCQPGDLLEWVDTPEEEAAGDTQCPENCRGRALPAGLGALAGLRRR